MYRDRQGHMKSTRASTTQHCYWAIECIHPVNLYTHLFSLVLYLFSSLLQKLNVRIFLTELV